MPATATAIDSIDWSGLVASIQANEGAGMEQLYRLFNSGMRYYVLRQLGPSNLEDNIHDVFIAVVVAIQKGDLREPSRLMGFVRTVVRRHVAAQIRERVGDRAHCVSNSESAHEICDPTENPEIKVQQTERAELVARCLAELNPRQGEILKRFYLEEQSESQIRDAMQLKAVSFRLLKSRAKGKFGKLGRQHLRRHSLPKVA